jgi:hypothetical protein
MSGEGETVADSVIFHYYNCFFAFFRGVRVAEHVGEILNINQSREG